MRKGFIQAMLLTIVGGLILIVFSLALAPTVGNQAQAIATGANQSAAAVALAPQLTTLWIVIPIAVALAIVGAVFGRAGG